MCIFATHIKGKVFKQDIKQDSNEKGNTSGKL
jgi:hypothetical protein